MEANENKFVYEGEVSGSTFKQVVFTPPDGTGSGAQGGGDYKKIFVFFGPVVVVESRREVRGKESSGEESSGQESSGKESGGKKSGGKKSKRPVKKSPVR